MRMLSLLIVFSLCFLSGCDNSETKAYKKANHLASLTCDSAKKGRSKEELQAIADACFKQGNYSKSSGIKW